MIKDKMAEYITLEGKIINSKGKLKQIKSTEDFLGVIDSLFASLMELEVEIDRENYKLPIKGSWPFEKGDRIKMYFEKMRSGGDGVKPFEINGDWLKKRGELDPKIIEKIVNNEVVFTYDDSWSY